MGFREQQAAIEKELDRFNDLLSTMLPRYSALLKKTNLSEAEIEELGDLEHFLIGVSGRINEIKAKLEQDVFGHGVDVYYKTKERANAGDANAQKKINRLRETFHESLLNGSIIQWN